jgi:hypothetical protein
MNEKNGIDVMDLPQSLPVGPLWTGKVEVLCCLQKFDCHSFYNALLHWDYRKEGANCMVFRVLLLTVLLGAGMFVPAGLGFSLSQKPEQYKVKHLSQFTKRVGNYFDDPSANPSFVFLDRFDIPNTYSARHGVTKSPQDRYEFPFDEARYAPNPLYKRINDQYEIVVVVNKNQIGDLGWDGFERGQTIRVYDRSFYPDDGLRYYWKASTASAGKVTPNGRFHPQSFSSQHGSNLYKSKVGPIPMFFSVFFHGPYAIHSTESGVALDNLGSGQSAGCVRLEDNRAQTLFHLIGHNQNRTLIIVK